MQPTIELPDFLPDTSDEIVSIPDFYRRSIPAAASLVSIPGQVGPVEFRWSTFQHVYGVLLLPDDGLTTSLAKLSLEMFDAHERPIFSDGRGFLSGVRQPNAQPCLGMFGAALRPFALDRVTRPHDRWTLTVKNSNVGAAIVVSSLVFLVRDMPR